jgi:LacI family transcriptional regulator
MKTNININTKDIAQLCGVSRGTVDRALNNRPGINPRTKEAILKVANEMGYRPHFVAQSLVKGKTMSLGLIIFDINNRIFAQLINAIEARAREHGYFVYLTLTNKDSQTEMQCIDHLIDRKVDGIMLLPVNKGRGFEQYLQKLSIPIVTFANRISGRFPNVWINDRQAVRDAVDYIVSRQYKEIIYVCPPLAAASKKGVNLYSPLERYEGFKEALGKLQGIGSTVIREKKFLPVIDELLHASNAKKAILCTSDIYAINIINHLKKRNVRIPEEAGIMGFDNIDILEYISPALTTIDYSAQDIGYRIVDTLIGLISGMEVPASTVLQHRIMARESL